MGENSLADYVTNPLVNVTTMGLIIASGLGFNVWWDLGEKNKAGFSEEAFSWQIIRTLRLQSKLVLTTTGILLLGGTICILLFEYKNPDTLGSLSFGQKLMAAAFQSVTTRTAGFLQLIRGTDQRKRNNLSVSYAGWRFSYGDCRRSEDDYTCSACDEYYCQPSEKKRM